MEISARNQLKARIKSIRTDSISAEVIVDLGGQEMCSSITSGSVERLKLQVGDDVTLLIKASSVMVMK